MSQTMTNKESLKLVEMVLKESIEVANRAEPKLMTVVERVIGEM